MFKMTSAFQAVTSLGSWANLTLSVTRQKHYLEKAELIKFAPLPEKEGLLASMMMQVGIQILLMNESKLESPSLYPLLVQFRNQTEAPIWHWLKLLTDYVALQGVPMVIDYCVVCQTKEKIVGISTHLGGLVCQTCLPKTDAKAFPALSLTRLRQLHKQPTMVGQDGDYLPLIAPVHHHLEYHVDIHVEGLKTLSMMMNKIHS
jgi:recombinational DNA repair protein (RecF pathway)